MGSGENGAYDNIYEILNILYFTEEILYNNSLLRKIKYLISHMSRSHQEALVSAISRDSATGVLNIYPTPRTV